MHFLEQARMTSYEANFRLRRIRILAALLWVRSRRGAPYSERFLGAGIRKRPLARGSTARYLPSSHQRHPSLRARRSVALTSCMAICDARNALFYRAGAH